MTDREFYEKMMTPRPDVPAVFRDVAVSRLTKLHETFYADALNYHQVSDSDTTLNVSTTLSVKDTSTQ